MRALWTWAGTYAVAFVAATGALYALRPVPTWVAMPIMVVVARGAVALWAWWLGRRDARRMAAIHRAVVEGLMDHVRPGWREEIGKPGDGDARS